MTNVNGILFFEAYDATSGAELWRSDGTLAGTMLVKDINPGSAGSFPDSLTSVNGILLFSAHDGTSGSELWRSDGTPEGTMLVEDINPGPADSFPKSLSNLNGTLLFQACDAASGCELWRSDGTAEGTMLVRDVNPGSADFGPGPMTNLNGVLFFRACDVLNGCELWRSDGTGLGTMLVRDINPGSGDSSPDSLTDVNGLLFFRACDATNGCELWRSDGTPGGTVLLGDVNPGSGNATPNSLTDVNGTLFFSAFEPSTSTELWSLGLCGFAPQEGCKAPGTSGAARLALLDKRMDRRDSVTWKWAEGAPTAKDEFGDPTATTAYALCIYDGQGGTRRLVFRATAPAGETCGTEPCWEELPTGFTYIDKARSPDGVQKIRLKEGITPGKAEIGVKAKGTNLSLPSLPLGTDPTVTVQLRNSLGRCWQATYGTPTVNDETRFKANSD